MTKVQATIYAALLGLILVMIPWAAQAETYAHVGAWSHHAGSSYDYNETHNLAALEHDQFMAGYFKNSYGDDSFMAAYRFRDQWAEHVEASVLVGGSHGYRADCLRPKEAGRRKVCPLVAPAVTYTQFRVEPSVLVMGNAVVLSVRWGL